MAAYCRATCRNSAGHCADLRRRQPHCPPENLNSSGISMERQQNIPLGIGLMLFGVLLFSVNDLLGKWLAASYTAPQILLLRSIIPFIILLVMLRGGGWRDFFNVSRPWMHV